jgi:hypothetical protein
MRSKRMLLGATLIGCVAAMIPGAYAQEINPNDQFSARPSTAGQPRPSMRQGPVADMNAQSNTRASNRASASGQLERRGFADEGRLNASTRERRGYAEARGVRDERGTYARMSEERYSRGLRGERGSFTRADVEGGYRGSRGVYRDRAFGMGTGAAIRDYGYRTRRLYAYAPSYTAGYTAGPTYSYSANGPGYVATGGGPYYTRPYYTPGWNVAYASPYYDYAPGVSFGVVSAQSALVSGPPGAGS